MINTTKMKVAIYRSEEYGIKSICEVSFEAVTGYVRITEFVEVELSPRKREDILKERVATIDEQIKEVQAVTEVKLNELKDKKQKLLALPQPGKNDLGITPEEIDLPF